MTHPAIAQAEAALDRLIILEDRISANSRYVHAEAGTGSKYVVTTTRVPTQDDLWAVAIFHPWQAAYFVTEGTALHPAYFMEKFGAGRAWPNTAHGGDVYALLAVVARATGCSFYSPEAL